MRCVSIGAAAREGLVPPHAVAKRGASGLYWALTAGEEGRGRWEARIPLGVRDFGVPEKPDAMLPLTDPVRLLSLGSTDRGTPRLLLVRSRPGTDDGLVLARFRLAPGFRGGASYTVHGPALVVAEGYEAQGIAGRMGGAPCPIIIMAPGASVTWRRSGRLYDTPADWRATWDGTTVRVAPRSAFDEEADAHAELPDFPA